MIIKDVITHLAEGCDLSSAEAEAVMRLIMNGEATDSQIAAFLMALKVKGETVDELAAFARVMREFCLRIHPKVVGKLVDTCGTGGDKVKTFNASTLAAVVASGAGVYVAKHGNRSVTSRCGSADLMEGLGVNIYASPRTVEECIEEVGLGFMFAPRYHSAMKHAAKARSEIGVKTVFNLLGPLTNPASAEAQLVGVYAADLTEKVAPVLLRLGVERAFVVHGLVGVDEISILGETRVAELREGVIRTYDVRPSMFGLREASGVEDLVGGGLEENLGVCFRVLEGMREARADMVLLNAAVGIVLGGRADDFVEGVEVAREAVVSGRALERLRLLVKKSGGDVGRFEEVRSKYLKAGGG